MGVQQLHRQVTTIAALYGVDVCPCLKISHDVRLQLWLFRIIHLLNRLNIELHFPLFINLIKVLSISIVHVALTKIKKSRIQDLFCYFI